MAENNSSGVSVIAAPEEAGLRVVDPVDNHQCRLVTPGQVDPVSASIDQFGYPVDTAETIQTTAIRLPTAVPVYVRDSDGALVASVEHLEEVSLEPGEYTLELLTPVKCYLRIESAVTLNADLTETRIEFGNETEVCIGARSRRTQPAATVTTTTNPSDLLATVATFGSALGTTMPERSYPSLRGHPPAVELGEALETRGLEPPSSNVWLELPETIEAALIAAPLAYYLGADIRPADEPRLVADGTVHPLSGGGEQFPPAVERTLKTVFFMDCLTRYDGAYGHGRQLHERESVRGELGLDFEELYHADHAERVSRYLSIPYRTIEPHLPQWKVVATARADPSSIELLPFLVDDLALVRTPDVTSVRADNGTATQTDAVASFLSGDETVRSASNRFTRGPGAAVSTRSSSGSGGGTGTTTASDMGDLSFVSPEPADAIEQVWVGEGIPFGANEAVLTAYQNRLAREPGDGEIEITVVCNDSAMAEETDVEAVYGQRDRLPFEVNLRQGLSTDELADLLTADTDFLHYIGHAEPNGLVCADGKFDCGELETVGAESFFLNACQSYQQARSLVEAGAIVGIASHHDVTNAGAVSLGRTMARLLEHGFPFGSALNLAREHHPTGQQYIVVGDGGLSITQCESGTALLCELERNGEEEFELTLKGVPTPTNGLGAEFMPYLNQAENTYYISSGVIDTYELTRSELSDFFNYGVPPVRFEGELIWHRPPDIDLR